MTLPSDLAPFSLQELVAHNVPAALSSFVGREREVAELRTLLRTARALTLVGPGGAGKTRLAREVAGAMAATARDGARFPDGVWWVELAPVRDRADVSAALAAVLGVSPSPGRRLQDALLDAVAPQQALLVLDNCEHVIDEAAHLVESLLRHAPALAVLCTSREALAIDGEQAWTVPPLARPIPRAAGGERLRADAASTFEAVQLFVDRTRAVLPSFALSDGNAPAVATICARLDGLPLALELAAASVPVLGVDGLASRLDDALTLLARGKRTALSRHRTLRALLDWSYELLGEKERVLLRRLSVFRSSCTLDAVSDVCGEPSADVIPVLGRLVEHSLVEVREEDGEARYRMLETVRQYGAALLQQSSEEHAVRERHARWVTRMAADAEPATFSAARGRTVESLKHAIDEIRAALLWATGADGSPALALDLAGYLGWFWISGVPWEEARTLIAGTLAAFDSQGIADSERPLTEQLALARVLYPVEGLAYFAGDTETMLSAGARSLAVCDRIDASPTLTAAQRLTSARARTLTLQLMGLAHAMRGEAAPAVAASNACVTVAEQSGDAWLLAVMLMRRALVHLVVGDHVAAQRDYETAVPALRAMGEWWFLSLALEGMSMNALAMGRVDAAAAYARDSVLVLRPEPDPWFISRGLDTLAYVLISRTDADTAEARATQLGRAAEWMGAAAALRQRCGAGIIGPDLARDESMHASLRAQLDEVRLMAARESGARHSLDAIFAALSDEATRDDATAGAVPAGAPGPAALEGTHVEVQLLGTLAMRRNGIALGADALPVGKVRELFLFLALHDDAAKEDVGLALWPDASAAQVRNLFHVTLHHLRRQLGTERWIVFERNRYRLDRTPGPDILMDIDADAVFAWSTRLRQAARRQQPLSLDELHEARQQLDRSRGQLGQGIVTEDWLVVHQDRLRAAWADGMESLAQHYHQAMRYDDVITVTETLVAREPLRESAHRLLMEALARRGEPARALAHFATLSDLLQREVGAKPAAATESLAASLRAGRT